MISNFNLWVGEKVLQGGPVYMFLEILVGEKVLQGGPVYMFLEILANEAIESTTLDDSVNMGRIC